MTMRQGKWRDTYTAVRECPLKDGMDLSECRKCPNFIEYWAWMRRIFCKLLSETEEKTKQEPDVDAEHKTRW